VRLVLSACTGECRENVFQTGNESQILNLSLSMIIFPSQSALCNLCSWNGIIK